MGWRKWRRCRSPTTPSISRTDRARRAGDLNRLKRGPAQVMRMGHGVIMTRQFKKALEWYRDTLGFLRSDEVYSGDPDTIVGSFNRCDRGEDFVDHHDALLHRRRAHRPQPLLL